MDFALGPAIQIFVTIYVDNINTISGALKDHCKHFRQVFERFWMFNVTVNLEKLKSFRTYVKFLGSIISMKVIRMDFDKIDTVMRLKPPRIRNVVQAYNMGFLNFYQKCKNNVAETIQPLIELLKKEKAWKWKETHE